MHHTIGETAGKIWKVLEKKGEMTTAQLAKETGESEFITAAALGWLAREDKISFSTKGRTRSVQIKS